MSVQHSAQENGFDDAGKSYRRFVLLFAVVSIVKVTIAERLPLFVDEAFYWLEGQRLAAAYSDLPGLTAWLSRLGVELGGHGAIALRAPFLALAACVPWLVARVTAREFGAAAGWRAASLALLLPLAGTLGLLALPDVAIALATVLCLDAAAGMLRRVDWRNAAELAMGLVIGALSHYRFAAIMGAGLVALLMLDAGRRALRDPRAGLAIAIGALAWVPLLAWNFRNADAGLRFQLVDRHPWAFHADGAWFIAIQCALVTPLLFIALGAAARDGVRGAAAPRLFAIFGGFIVLAFFVLGFFTDTERVSFHWPLPGYLALLLVLPATLARWPRWLRASTWTLAAIGLVLVFAYLLAVSVPRVRAQAAAGKWYPSNFAGWDPLAKAARDMRAIMPGSTRLVADNFKIGAEVGFELGDPDIEVLDHPLNHKHGRAPQLRLWGLEVSGGSGLASLGTASRNGKAPDGAPADNTLLIVGVNHVKFSALLDHYQTLCERFGNLPAARFVNVDHGQQRFALFALPAARATNKRVGKCITPAVAHIKTPEPHARVGTRFRVEGWAIQDHVGIAAVTITLDGTPVAEATMGRHDGWVAEFYKGRSRDPDHPNVGFRAEVDASGFAPGRHWLGMRLRGKDGSRQEWAERAIEIRQATTSKR